MRKLWVWSEVSPCLKLCPLWPTTRDSPGIFIRPHSVCNICCIFTGKVEMLAFENDQYVHKSNQCLESLISDMEKTPESKIKWPKKSWLKVNQSKTEVCRFYKNDIAHITLPINKWIIISAQTINVFGIIFDTKLNWAPRFHNLYQKPTEHWMS
jgi:hypothetical protein